MICRRAANHVIPTFIILLILAYTVGSLHARPSMYSDCGWGFHILHSMNQGAPFNYGVSPDITDISRDKQAYLTWWTPGQYFIPGLLTYCGMNLGTAITLTVAVFSTLGILGWYAVYRSFGFSDSVAWTTCLIIATSRYFALPFGIYNGGEILLFGASPFVLLLSLQCYPHLLLGILMVAALLAGYFLKSSALVLALAVCIAAPLSDMLKVKPLSRSAILTGCKWAAVFLTTYAICKATHLSRGPTPTAFEPHLASDVAERCCFVLAGPLFSSVSLDDLLNFLLSHPSRPLLLQWHKHLALILPFAIASFATYSLVLLRYSRSRYGVYLFVFLTIYVLFLGLINLLGAAVSSDSESRHYRIAGLLLLPGVLEPLLNHKSRYVVWLASATALVFSFYGLSSYALRYASSISHNRIGLHGFSQNTLDRETLRWIIEADSELQDANSIFYLTSPEMEFELRNARAILSHAEFESIELLASRRIAGVVDNLFIILPERFSSNGKAAAILSSFVDYHDWGFTTVGGFRIYYSRKQHYLPSNNGDAALEAQ
jgi:hypothetical protein